MMDIDAFTTQQRRTLVFIKAYEDCRRKSGQYGYRAFKKIDINMVEKPVFKQFLTVVSWLDTSGWEISWKDYHWQGYLIFAFSRFKPSIPQPGQLRNQVILREYLLAAPVENSPPKPIPESELEEMYKKRLHPAIKNELGLLRDMGLRGITYHASNVDRTED